MMNKLITLKADGSLKFSIGCNMFKKFKRNGTWFTEPEIYIPLLIVCFFTDIFGFAQIADATMSTSFRNRCLIIASFTIAFEAAPLYIGYAICLKYYELSQKIHKIIFVLSSISFILGISANIIYRLMTVNSAYQILDDNGKWINDKNALPMTILMIILPLITSLINIVIGCLSFDPLLLEIHKLSKKLNILHTKKQQLLAYIEELDGDSKTQEELKKARSENYDYAKVELLATRARLINYISTCSVPINNNGYAKKGKKSYYEKKYRI